MQRKALLAREAGAKPLALLQVVDRDVPDVATFVHRPPNTPAKVGEPEDCAAKFDALSVTGGESLRERKDAESKGADNPRASDDLRGRDEAPCAEPICVSRDIGEGGVARWELESLQGRGIEWLTRYSLQRRDWMVHGRGKDEEELKVLCCGLEG
jgi:hypothetical protein